MLNLSAARSTTLASLADIATRHFCDDAAEGIGGVIRHGSGGSGEGLVRNAFDAMPAGVRNDCMESVAEASGKTLKRNANSTTGVADLRDMQRVEEGLGATRGIRTAHFRSAVLEEIGPGKAFRSMEEFESLRFMRASDLRTNQVEAMLRIRNAVPAIAEGDQLRMVMSLDKLEKCLKDPSDPDYFPPNLLGFVSRADDVDDVVGGSASVVVSKLRLPDNAGLDPSRGYAVIETNSSATITAACKTPKSQGFLADPARDTLVSGPDYTYPFVGNGFVADLGGRLRPEFAMTTPIGLPVGARIKKYSSSGTLESSFRLAQSPENPGLLIWVPE